MNRNGMRIYFVTVFFVPSEYLDNQLLWKLKEKPDGWESYLYKRIRCWGWFKNEEDAEKCIRENWTDIYENGYYNLAMIEPFTEGPLGLSHKDDRWFRVTHLGNGKYDIVEINKPINFKGFCGFSYA